MSSEIVIAQTTIDDEDQAKALARGAVENRFAACAHIDQPFTAVYRWKGAIETAQEWRISYKTTTGRLPELAAWVAANHGYEVPEWITLPVTGGSEAYLAWVVEETTPEPAGSASGGEVL
ncbi:divalent-cation tolerance protein CutA [Streptomyces sp. IBSBF 2950]|uniref:divalent-cation tolerance protein CutA n=1 Tax=Streptomyces sp. IBSBF 2950 TaxID=2903528 RepID=UPI002FDBF5B1